MQWFLGKFFCKSHAKFENTKRLNVTDKRFKRHVYDKLKFSLSQTLKYFVNISYITDNT